VTFTLTRRRKLIIAAVVLAPIVFFAPYTSTALTGSYSQGARAG